MGWTSAEYERPVSLRHFRSWRPARKSRASRIMGERDVRSIAASTSASTEASVPSTIWMTIGSIGGPVFMPCPISRGSTREDQIAEVIRLHALAGIDDRGRAVLLDDRRPVQHVARLDARAVVEPTLDGLLREHDRPRAGERAGWPPVALRPLAQPGPRDRSDAGDAQIHPLDRLAASRPALACWAIAVAVPLLVRVVESLRRHSRARLVELARGQLHRHLPGLAEIAQIGTALDAHLVGGEALGAERRAGQRLQARQVRVDGRVVEPVVALDERLHVVLLHTDPQKPEGR